MAYQADGHMSIIDTFCNNASCFKEQYQSVSSSILHDGSLVPIKNFALPVSSISNIKYDHWTLNRR